MKQRGVFLSVSALVVISLSSCAIAPASVKRMVNRTAKEDVRHTSLHALLTEAMKGPEGSGKHALAHFIENWRRAGRGSHGDVPRDSAGGVTYRVRFNSSTPGSYPPEYFDVISPAEDFEVRKIAHHSQDGIGTPLLALRENKQREPVEKWYPPEVIARPVTAVAHKGRLRGGIQEVSIDLLCPMAHGGKVGEESLAADYSVPWAAALSLAGELNRSKVLDMLTPTPKREPRLYLMEPYDPNREPLIMIHGLLSSPLAWAGLSNELWGTPAIRQRYQIWHYLYNASAPALYSGRLLRAQLKELRTTLDPEGDDPAMRRTTLLTHSMGGLVGKSLAVEPGDVFWKAAFNVPPEKLVLSAKDRKELQEAFEWRCDQSVHRIIFVATPHRGSDFADNFIGRIGGLITAAPQAFQAFYQRISASNPGVFTPAYERLGKGELNSVNSLSPRQPTLQIMADMPFQRGVVVHSIIGNRGREGPVEGSSDGIVPYTSSHLADASSECIVPAGHRAFRHPRAVAEIQRILQLP